MLNTGTTAKVVPVMLVVHYLHFNYIYATHFRDLTKMVVVWVAFCSCRESDIVSTLGSYTSYNLTVILSHTFLHFPIHPKSAPHLTFLHFPTLPTLSHTSPYINFNIR